MCLIFVFFFFFFSSRRRHTRLVSDWSSDVCSSDLAYEDALGCARLRRSIWSDPSYRQSRRCQSYRGSVSSRRCSSRLPRVLVSHARPLMTRGRQAPPVVPTSNPDTGSCSGGSALPVQCSERGVKSSPCCPGMLPVENY